MNDIQSQKQRIDLIGVMESAGVTLQKQGKDYACLCPFHAEKTPSCLVEPNKQFFYCFGCGANGDVVDFVCMHYGLTFPQGLEFLGIKEQTHKVREIAREQKQKDQHKKKRSARQRALYHEFQGWTDWYTSVLVGLVDTTRALLKTLPWSEVEQMDGVVRQLSTWKYHLWLIQRVGNEDLIYELYREKTGKR